MASDLDLNVVISAESQGLADGMSAAQAKVEESTSSMTESFAVMSERIGEFMAESSEQVTEHAVEMKEQLEGISKSIKGMSETFALIGEVAIFGEIGKQIFETAVAGAEYAEKINLAAQKTGVAADQLQVLKYAALTVGVSFDGVVGGIEKFNRASVDAREGNKQLAAAFKAVGISEEDLKNDSTYEQLEKLSEAFANSADNSDKTALAIQFFGRAGAELIPLLDKGKEGLEELGAEAASVGGIMDSEAREKAQEFAEQLKLASEASEGLKLKLSAELQPAMSAITQEFIEQSKEGGILQTLIDALSGVIEFLTKAFMTLDFILTSVGKTLAALTVAVVQFDQLNIDGVRAAFQGLGEDIATDYDKLDQMFDRMNNPPEKIDFGMDEEKKKSLHAPGGAGEKEKSQIAAFEAQLELQKMNNDKMNDEDETFHQFSVEQEKEFWATKLNLASLSTEDRLNVQKKYYAAAVAVDKDQFESGIESLKRMEAQENISSDTKIELAELTKDAVVKAYGEESKEGQAAIKEYEAVIKQVHEEKVKLAEDAAKKSAAFAEAGITQEEALWKLGQSKRASSQDEVLSQEQTFADRKYQIQRQELDAELALQKEGTLAYQQKLSQIEALEKTHNSQMELNAAQAAQIYALNWNMAFESMQSGMAKAMTDILSHTASISSAIRTLMTTVGTAILNMLAKTAAEWAVDNAKKLVGFGQQSAAATTSAAAQDTAATSVAVSNKAAAAIAAESWAGVAGAAGTASFAGAPWPIDMGAAGFGAAMFAEASAFTPAAAKGFDIPAGVNPLTQLHEKEMVLPAHLAEPMRDMANGGGGGGGSVQLHVHATDAQSVRRLFEQNGAALADVLKKQNRNFAFAGKS